MELSFVAYQLYLRLYNINPLRISRFVGWSGTVPESAVQWCGDAEVRDGDSVRPEKRGLPWHGVINTAKWQRNEVSITEPFHGSECLEMCSMY